jgi:lipopolysaccharide biosynthesis glycosyltransferase
VELNILVSIDRAYVTQLNALLHSLYLNNAQNDIHVHLLHSALTGEDISALSDTARKYGGTLVPYSVIDDYMQISDVLRGYPPEVFYRLFCTDYLPGSVKRVLYLDSDIIINGPLESLFNIDLTEDEGDGGRRYIFAAAADADNNTIKVLHRKRKIGLPPEIDYVNSGVILMDLDLMRESVSTAEIIKQVSNYRLCLAMPDQDLFNILFYKDILHLDRYMYNYCPTLNNSWIYNFKAGYPAIIHFAGPKKPWMPSFPTDNIFAVKSKELYDYYASL